MSTTRQHLSAVIYDKRGRVLSVGENSYIKTHPLQAEHARKTNHPEKIYLHAEVAALVKCRGKPYKIKIERKNKNGEYRLAKPCPVCESAIKAAGIKFVEYSVG